MNRKNIRALMLTLLGALWALPASSANVTVNATGQLFNYYDPGNWLPFPEPSPNVTFTLTFTYDNGSAPTSSYQNIVYYGGAISAWSLTIGGQTVASLPLNEILIENDSLSTSNSGTDTWAARTYSGGGFQHFDLITFELWDRDGIEIASNALIAPSPFPSATWDLALIDYIVIDNYQTVAEAYARLDSVTVVPIPAVGWLLGSALGVLGWVRRKRPVV